MRLSRPGFNRTSGKERIPTRTHFYRWLIWSRSWGDFQSHQRSLSRRTDKNFPSKEVFSRFGGKAELIVRLREFCSARGEHEIADLCGGGQDAVEPSNNRIETTSNVADGYVYMLKHGKHYKIGKTFSVPRRHREIALELPEKPDIVHTIRTDDPTGIEAYWHSRFASKRTNGEWFELTREDVQAFKKRKFM